MTPEEGSAPLGRWEEKWGPAREEEGRKAAARAVELTEQGRAFWSLLTEVTEDPTPWPYMTPAEELAALDGMEGLELTLARLEHVLRPIRLLGLAGAGFRAFEARARALQDMARPYRDGAPVPWPDPDRPDPAWGPFHDETADLFRRLLVAAHGLRRASEYLAGRLGARGAQPGEEGCAFQPGCGFRVDEWTGEVTIPNGASGGRPRKVLNELVRAAMLEGRNGEGLARGVLAREGALQGDDARERARKAVAELLAPHLPASWLRLSDGSPLWDAVDRVFDE